MAQSIGQYPVNLIYQAAKGVWFENLAVRPNGLILTTLLTYGDLYQLNPLPTGPDLQLVHHFHGYDSLLGITEEQFPDSYQVIACNFTLSTRSVMPNSISLFRVRFLGKQRTPYIRLTARLPSVGLANGLTTLNDHTVLLADSIRGNIVAIDTNTGANKIIISDPLLKPNGEFFLGVNGLKIFPRDKSSTGNTTTLFFTNGAQDIFGRVEIDGNTGAARGPLTIIAHGLNTLPGEPASAVYDDFAIDSEGKAAYLTTGGGNSIVRVDIATGQQRIIAGDLNSTEIAEPTAAFFGRGSLNNVLYVTTSGGLAVPVNGDIVVGGQVLAIETGEHD